jgi:FKBP-type peptidyl-prolyl cis-trans isomerase
MNITKQEWITLAIGIIIIGGLLYVSMRDGSTNNIQTRMNTHNETTPSQLEKTDIHVGTGAEAKEGSTVSVHYTGTFANGQKFDSSHDRGEPITFVLGSGNVIKGWDVGLIGMKVGGKRKLVIPPELGYGATAYGPIPGNSTLYFEVELLDVK